jgi:hypothetical protein
VGPDRGAWVRRLAVTLIVPVVALLLARISLPGVDVSLLERLAAGNSRASFDVALMGILAIELTPFISASWWVESLALVVPGWRRWRLGGYPERANLWARVKLIALVLALVQSFFIVVWLQHTSDRFPAFLGSLDLYRDDHVMFVAQMLSLVGGTFLLYWLARLIDRYGAGNGMTVLIAAFTVVPVGWSLFTSVRHTLERGEGNLLPLALGAAAVAVAAVTRLASGRPLRPGRAPLGTDVLPAPSSGVKPIGVAVAILQLPESIARLGNWVVPKSLEPGGWTVRGLEAVFTAATCVVVAWAFNQPRVVAKAWLRAGVPEMDAQPAQTRAAFARALGVALIVCGGLLAVQWFCADAGVSLSLIGATLIACVVADVVGELRFRARQGAVAGVWPVHRLYLLTPLLAALDAAGIPAFPRARCYRTLWNFFAPFAPVEILVPVGDAIRAEAILRPLAGEAPYGQQ